MISLTDNTDNFEPLRNLSITQLRESEVKNPKFTIAIPAYKRVDLLKEALDSALKQTYDDYNILIVDDWPERNDETEKYLMSLESNRITYIKTQENLGLIKNFNRLFLYSDGQYVVMLHDDDMLTLNCLNILDNMLKKDKKIDVILSRRLEIGPGASVEEVKKLGNLRRIIKGIVPIGLPIAANMFCNNFFGPPSCGFTVKRTTAIESGGFSDELGMITDWLYCLRLQKKYKISKAKERTGIYRWSNNVSAQEKTKIEYVYDEQEIIKILVANDRICSFWRKFLKKDFDKKLNAKYGDEIKYSRLYHIVKKYYDLRVRPYGV